MFLQNRAFLPARYPSTTAWRRRHSRYIPYSRRGGRDALGEMEKVAWIIGGFDALQTGQVGTVIRLLPVGQIGIDVVLVSPSAAYWRIDCHAFFCQVRFAATIEAGSVAFQLAEYCAENNALRCAKAVASAATRLMAPPYESMPMPPLPSEELDWRLVIAFT